MGWHDKYVREAQAKCEVFGLHPKHDPMGDDHHTDAPFSSEDREIGDALAWFLGGLFIDVEDRPNYMHQEMTSVDVWTRVARALRVHGLCIADLPKPINK